MRILEESFDITAWRKRMGWSQAKAAKLLGMSLGAYCETEYRQQEGKPGIRNPVRSTLVKLCCMYEAFKEIGQDPQVVHDQLMQRVRDRPARGRK